MNTSRRLFLTTAAASAALPLASPAIHAQTRLTWRMATSWPKNFPGPGVSAETVARRVGELSGGRFIIQPFAAGEIVPALQVMDAVSNGTVECGHSTPYYWHGKAKETNFFTTIPFGPDPLEHDTWITRGGGQALWDELYAARFNAKGFMAGNAGPSMGGWFKTELTGLADIRGLKIRAQGLGGELWQRLGATPVSVAPGDMLISFGSGVIDAVEFLAPLNDMRVGLHGPASFYYAPGFNKPNSTAEFTVYLPAWEKLPGEFKAIIEAACTEATAQGLTEAVQDNASALVELLTKHRVQLRRFPDDILKAARQNARELIGDLAAATPLGGRILASLEATRERTKSWRRVMLSSTLALQE